MPSGLAMSILAANAKDKITYNDRDDITLKDTLKEIKRTLDHTFECIVPAPPYDNLFADYDDARQKRFMDALDEFISDAEKALKEPNELKASKLWQKHLGDRFPDGEDKEQDQSKNIGLIAGASTSRPYGN